ncbi:MULTISPECIES: LysR family transcriptional regulator [unclassified Caballeronia]|jgi:DNA-binding transcriptional LysR family regulator|uniref:LysR family transcriptional regulator n=1 Tax=unclassified Caballeronia TaxID=2646786 RepID=UPI00285E85F0|nr:MULTISPECIES: LysR family transcriptional regulator [unclassified Caballeronia]MDR5774272.1 LysR family transcriptional regulator [Caballeronia sp. LZ002]MDR5849707.1 LysR family transcriptional regulator [Caballeronia sp. LZ003]
MNLSFEVLQALDAIDRTGTFAKAAEALHKVPSSLTYLVQKLELDLGVTLFDRTGRRATLTQAGRLVVDEGRRLLEAAADLERKAKRVQHGWETELRLGIDEIIPFDMLWKPVSAFYSLKLDTRLVLSKEVLGGSWDALLTRRADLVVGAAGEPPLIPDLIAKPIGSLKHVFVVAPNHPLASAKAPLSADTVAQHRAVAIGDTSRELAPRTIAIGPNQEVLTVPSLEAKLHAQLQGIAAGTIPECLADEHLRRGTLVSKEVIGMRDITYFYLAWRSDRVGRALQWWVDQLDRPDLIDEAAHQRIAAA